MRIRFLFYISVFFISSSIFSQDFNGGILGGLATTEVSGDRLEGPNKAGLYLGAFVNRYISERSSFQMELDFIQKGSSENPDSTNNYYKYRLFLDYIEIPVHYKYDFHPKGTLETGLSLGVLVRKNEKVNDYPWVSGKDNFDTFDLSFNIGAFYSLTEDLRINVRYSNSLLPIRPHPGGATWRFNKGQYNEVLSFVLFYEF